MRKRSKTSARVPSPLSVSAAGKDRCNNATGRRALGKAHPPDVKGRVLVSTEGGDQNTRTAAGCNENFGVLKGATGRTARSAGLLAGCRVDLLTHTSLLAAWTPPAAGLKSGATAIRNLRKSSSTLTRSETQSAATGDAAACGAFVVGLCHPPGGATCVSASAGPQVFLSYG